MNSWKEYQKLLNTKSIEEHRENGEQQKHKYSLEKNTPKREMEDDNITKEELLKLITELKNGKAPGHDKIITEMIKYRGEKGHNCVWG